MVHISEIIPVVMERLSKGERMKEELGYCVKCRIKGPIVEGVVVKMKNGRPAMKGKCGNCGCGIYKILPITTSVTHA